MLQIFFDVCTQVELGKVKETYISIFSSLLLRFKDGTDCNKETSEEIPLLFICLLSQESIPLDNPPPD